MLCGGSASAQVVSVHLQPPRDFGYFVGGLLTSTTIVTVAAGTTLDLRSLPPVGPVSPVADVRAVTVGGTAERVEIRVTYQEFFSPEQVLAARIPGYSLAFFAHGVRLAVAVPGFGFVASPFRHDLQPTLDPAAMRADHAPVMAGAPGAAWAIAAGLGLMAAGLAFLLPAGLAGRRCGPFAAAAAQARGMAGSEAGREMLRALHRAFDATAGRAMFAEDIDEFLVRHPHLAPLRARIAAFFVASRAVFFGGAGEVADAPTWLALCRALARAERRR